MNRSARQTEPLIVFIEMRFSTALRNSTLAIANFVNYDLHRTRHELGRSFHNN